MIITVASQKGGVGKTTLSILLANFLSDKGHIVNLLDYDKQKTATYFFEKKSKNEEALLYNVETIDSSNEEALTDSKTLKMLKEQEDIFVVDTAGILSENYLQVLIHSDYILIPFNYTEAVLHSTVKFSKFCKKLVQNNTLVFVSNMVHLPRKRDREKVLESWQGIDEIISHQGVVLKNKIYDQRRMENLTVVGNDTWQKKNTDDAFSEMYNLIFR